MVMLVMLALPLVGILVIVVAVLVASHTPRLDVHEAGDAETQGGVMIKGGGLDANKVLGRKGIDRNSRAA